ncbi:MAG: 16S rRNA (guanine(966)-N(2))-methyltransferase RsmD [Frankia sp.]|nr:16S rRNA (guanine(966)-N(2))-methyltransferase RsmD [Frankia sp.]
MRIVAGAAGGRRLAVPAGRGTRPTTERTREAMFSSIISLVGPLDGLRVLDLYAGSGAFGLEALSRGAAHALLVESDAKALAVLRRNVETVGMAGAVVRADKVERTVAEPTLDPYDLVVADPPYRLAAATVDAVLASLASNNWLRRDALVVVERSTRSAALTWPDGIERVRERRYGEGRLWYGRSL